MTILKLTNGKKRAAFALPFKIIVDEHSKSGLLALAATLICVSFLVGVNLHGAPSYLISGELADEDVIAPKNLTIYDDEATKAKREQVAQLEPGIFELDMDAFSTLRNSVQEIFYKLNTFTTEEVNQFRMQISQDRQMEIQDAIVKIWGSSQFQSLVSSRVLPFLESRLRLGVVRDSREFLNFRGGILLLDPVTQARDFYLDTSNIYDLKSLNVEINQYLKNELRASSQMRQAVNELLEPIIPPSLIFNEELTATNIETAMTSVRPVEYEIRKGDLLVRKGERISREKQLRVNALRQSMDERFEPTTFLGVLAISFILSLGLFISPSGRKGSLVTRRDLLLISFVLLIFAVLSKFLAMHGEGLSESAFFNSTTLPYVFPVAGAAGLASMVFSARRYCVTGLLLAFLCTVMAGAGLALFLFYFLSCMTNTWLVSRAQTRNEMFFSIIPLSIILTLLWFGCAAFDSSGHLDYSAGIAAAVLHSVGALVVVFVLSPVLEIIFNYTTRFKLMELMNLEQPLLQELMMAAPGTYHHSLIMANMAEAGAKAVGANPLLCKVAALYHDIGKLPKPEYFIENLMGRENRHDKLSPSMSALILISHAKKGVELAQQHKLGDEITDIIRQHHGTNVIRYFYEKAKDLGENPKEEDYRYPGPRPQTKEAAIIMLADAVEASSRVLSDPLPGRIQSHIDKLMRNIFAEGQLDESALTFKDLHKLSETFMRIITGVFHHRIEYPEAMGKEDKKKGPLPGEGGLPGLGAGLPFEPSAGARAAGYIGSNGYKVTKFESAKGKSDNSEPGPPAYPQPMQGGGKT